MSYPKLYRALAHADALCFFDVEASQYRMDLLSLGMVVSEKKRETLFLSSKTFDEFYFVLKPERNIRIGKRVEEITHLTKDDLNTGMSKEDVEVKIRSALDQYQRIAFVSYGELDKKVFLRSLFRKSDDALWLDRIHFFDFHKYLQNSLVREKGGSYSLSSLMELFSLPYDSIRFHNPLDDSICLYRIFSYFVSHEEEIRIRIRENSQFNPKLRSCSSFPESDLEKGIFRNL